MPEIDYGASWVPDDDQERDWDDAAELAAAWVQREAERLNVEPLLVTPTQAQWDAGSQVISQFVRRYAATTPRSSRVGVRPASVLAYVPDYETIHLAMRHARGGSLAVVESVATPLRGWAVEAKALDLSQGTISPDDRSEHLREALESIQRVGNNGWTNGFGKDAAVRVLQELHSRGDLDPDLVLGYVLARGQHAKAVERLAKIIEGVRNPGGPRRGTSSRAW
ncbi:hypothetical protein [Frankia sp. Cr1]|uniref:hypothetical protein n=1 Tax=Frankia sp. Cr1 TaxID=3073931 RepID=UPI002AD24696|nr:hypothetical protein [Frankia sp. Cr1]